MKVNILGTEYRVEWKKRADDPSLNEADGYFDKTSKRIVVCEKDADCDLDNFPEYCKKVLRHEIVHAFMYESGLGENWEHKNIGQEETVVDWFAIQGPKIIEAWKHTECI